MGVALENARLFDETKRLLTETDERAAELAVVNSVQQGLAAKLDMQSMYDLVGDKLQEIFDAQEVDIAAYEPRWSEPATASWNGLRVLTRAGLSGVPAALDYRNVFRVLIMQFLDAYNFDVRSVKKTCVHIVHPDGRIIPFDTYNLFYRDEKERRLEQLRNVQLSVHRRMMEMV